MQVRRADRLASQTVRFGYTVSGESAFPLDMLRIDGSYPASACDVAAIIESLAAAHPASACVPARRRLVNLFTVRGMNWLPIQSRWRLHGWRVE